MPVPSSRHDDAAASSCDQPMRGIYGATTICARPAGHTGKHDPIWNHKDWPEASSAASVEPRWCGEVTAHEGHAWAGSGQEYACDGVPLEDSQEASAAQTHDWGDGWVSLNDVERMRMIEHLDGLPWLEAPIPSRFHRCKPQTRGLFDDVERCACGAIRFRHGRGSGVWGERNSRRKERSRAAA